MERPLPDLVTEARRFALQARQNAFQISEDYQKREWLKIAATWDRVAAGYERLIALKALALVDARALSGR